MKKTICLAVIVTLIVSLFSGCTGKDSALAIEDSLISAGVYAYYMSQSGSQEEARDICIKNVAAENIMKKE